MTELSSITDKRRQIGDYIRLAWYFETPLEKIVLVIFGALGLWKILDLFAWIASK